MSRQSRAHELDPNALRRVYVPDALGFASTEEVEPLDGTVGQSRANEAIAFGLDAQVAGYNIFAAGPAGVGKRTSLEAHLKEHARRRPPPGDWVYLHNFREPRHPIAVLLASGQGQRLAADMHRFLQDARRELAGAFESETYARRQREVTEPIEREQEAAMAELREQARADAIAVEFTPAGVITVPLRGGQPMTPAEFGRLPGSVRARYQAALEELGPRTEAFLTKMRALQRDSRERLRALEREVALFAVGHLIDELKEGYASSAKLVQWLEAVAEDVTENRGQFQALGQDGGAELPSPSLGAVAGAAEPALGRYEVNVFVAHDADGGAPVVLESNPTYPNLFGRIEHHGVFGGGFVTDHRMLRSGAVHRANGGYLMLPAAEVLAQPLVWLKLKEVLRTGQIRLENLAEQYALFPTATLTPEPIELDIKVVLVGSPLLYGLAYMLAEDREWLSTRFVEIGGIAAEASHWASKDGSELVGAEHVDRAIRQKVRRSDLIEQRLLELVAEGMLLLDFEGRRVGQVNGLSVIELGDYTFGRPIRITASAGPGRGALVSIERETGLSGHIHDKGFMILSGYLRERYGGERRIALAANLTFEQSYEQIEGDSAASAELYALLSELAGVPLRQDIAVTGSVNQHGELQAIGGANEKIEGFHRACKLRELTGRQGVIIPQSNVRNLMLSQEVVDSVRAGRFHVWSARTVDEGIELLTGMPAGERGADGRFPEVTLHARVEERLERWARLADKERATHDEDLRTS